MKILLNKKLKLLLKSFLLVQTSRLSMQIQSVQSKWDDNVSYIDKQTWSEMLEKVRICKCSM